MPGDGEVPARPGWLVRGSDLLKRPGPHRAYVVDLDEAAHMRSALIVARAHSLVQPLARVLGIAADPLDGDALGFAFGAWCARGDSVGLGYAAVPFAEACDLGGEPLLPYAHESSPFWHRWAPWVPQMVVSAADLLAGLPDAAAPIDDRALAAIDAYVTEEAALAGFAPGEVQADALVAYWREQLAEAVAHTRAALAPVAAADGHVLSWFEDQGYL